MKTVKGNMTRPTSDRVKESLFNIIAGFVPEAEVLDLFAGTGNLGIEALSRGACFAVFSDRSADSISVIKENLSHTRLSDKSQVLAGDAVSIVNRLGAEHRKFDIIFLDPPYSKGLVDEALDSIVKNDLIKVDSIIIAESDSSDVLPEEAGCLKRIRSQKYGDTVLSFYRNNQT